MFDVHGDRYPPHIVGVVAHVVDKGLEIGVGGGVIDLADSKCGCVRLLGSRLIIASASCPHCRQRIGEYVNVFRIGFLGQEFDELRQVGGGAEGSDHIPRIAKEISAVGQAKAPRPNCAR